MKTTSSILLLLVVVVFSFFSSNVFGIEYQFNNLKIWNERHDLNSEALKKGGAVYVGYDQQFDKYFYDLVPQRDSGYVAVGFLREDTNSTGWAYLEITNDIPKVIPWAKMANVNDSVRAYTAGLAEGFLTSHLIDLHWINTMQGYCDPDANYCKRLDKFIEDNLHWARK